MTNEEIKQKLESSFHPYRCAVEIRDYKQKIRFRIFDQHDKPIITVPELKIKQIDAAPLLESVISQTKDEIRRKGYLIS